MKKSRPFVAGCFAAAAMGVLILDSKTAVAGAQKGLFLCIETIIPSLFPFFLLSNFLTDIVSGHNIPFAAPFLRIFRISPGSEGLLLTGLLGGFPIGAQCVSHSFEKGSISAENAERMLIICNNCGPAFLFGMAASIFKEWYIPWFLWAIQVASVLMSAALIPGIPSTVTPGRSSQASLPAALQRSLRSLATVCGWVILFRIVITFLDVWILWLLPTELQCAITGIFELSNGCFDLVRIRNTGLRFVLCAGILNFGGICVFLQTFSIISPRLNTRMYFPGKVFQSCFSMMLSCCVQSIILPQENSWHPPLWIGLIAFTVMIFVALILRKSKNKCSICQPIGV